MGLKKNLLLGLDLGGTKLASGVVTKMGEVLAYHSVPNEFSKGRKGYLAFLVQQCELWLSRYPSIELIGIGSCGPLDPRQGVLLQPTNFPRWGRLPVKNVLMKKFSRFQVKMTNDAAAVAGAEGWVGGARRLQNWISLTLGTGLGTGIVMQRKVFLGGSGFGPEAGHHIITDRSYPCNCGNNGCAEAVLSGTGLKRRIDELGLSGVSPEALVQKTRAGSRAGKKVFHEFAAIGARLVHNLAVTFAPQAIFLSGGLASAHDLFLPELTRQARELLRGRPGCMPRIGLSRLGKHAGILGGAWTAHTGDY